MNKFNLNISVQKGKIVLNRQKVVDYFANLKDGEYQLSVTSEKRAKGRYKYYFGRILPLIAQEREISGTNAIELIHEFCKLRFCKTPIINPFTGEIDQLKGGSTTLLNDTQFNEYQEEVMAYFAAEFGIDFSVLFST